MWLIKFNSPNKSRLSTHFTLQSALNEAPLGFFFDIFNILCALGWPYILCHYATIVKDRVSSIGYLAYDSNWPDFPSQFQKYIILFIARSQEPINFTGLKMLHCSLEVFGKVFNLI